MGGKGCVAIATGVIPVCGGGMVDIWCDINAGG